jgi:hypothetical protein
MAGVIMSACLPAVRAAVKFSAPTNTLYAG